MERIVARVDEQCQQPLLPDKSVIDKRITRRKMLIGTASLTAGLLIACKYTGVGREDIDWKSEKEFTSIHRNEKSSIRLLRFEGELFEKTEAQRMHRVPESPLPPLMLDDDLIMVARARSQDMAINGYFSHKSPEGVTAFKIIDQINYVYENGWLGENLAKNNYPTSRVTDVAIRDLMASPGHRDNILNSHYTRIGIGWANNGSTMHYLTMIFAGPA